ncbi:hypothetical protein L208DRAFT_1425858 [Tricholoma matsutake]|nr:hypothetical protein L208DRAFT_1425858 [Tricholoma matsutake 945]
MLRQPDKSVLEIYCFITRTGPAKMAPKKSKKISLNEFLGDSTLGSWADEMDSLPSAPAARTDDDQGRPKDRYGRKDDFLSSRLICSHLADRSATQRDDLPLPTQPPYTAFIGNLAFDLTEMELEDLFSPLKTKSVKIIRDREDKPKGFGYIEFEDLEGLKEAIAKSGSNFAGRNIRVSVAEPPKERPGFGGAGGGFDDDSKFDSPWRRDGPLPDLHDSRDSRRRPSSGDRTLPSVAEGASDWRSNRSSRSVHESEPPSYKRKGSGFSTPEGQIGAADKEEVWSKGSKFVPSTSGQSEERFGSLRGRGDMAPPKDPTGEEGDWRSSARPRPGGPGGGGISPSNSTPPTPQMGRRKLELLPRSGNASATPSPLSSPKMGPTPPTSSSSSRANPFGAARPVDVSNREKEVAERLDREREATKDRLSMSRTNSRQASERTPTISSKTPPPTSVTSPQISASSKVTNAQPKSPNVTLAPNVRPTLSFANVAANKEAASENRVEEANDDKLDANIEKVTERVAEVVI